MIKAGLCLGWLLCCLLLGFIGVLYLGLVNCGCLELLRVLNVWVILVYWYVCLNVGCVCLGFSLFVCVGLCWIDYLIIV